jgi:hypothetical protein
VKKQRYIKLLSRGVEPQSIMDFAQLHLKVTYKPHNHKLLKNPCAYETKHIYNNRLGIKRWVLGFKL